MIRSEHRKRLFKLLAMVAPTLVGVAAVVALLIHQERLVIDLKRGTLRFQSPPLYLEEPNHETTGHRYLHDPELGWRNIPNWRANTHGRTLTINSRGLRDREYDLERRPGVPRMLVLGDSFAWGYGVSDEENFTEVLERELAAVGKPWEVINTGVSGWGTDQQYLFFRSEGVRYQPDLVVLAFYAHNDPLENSASVAYGMGKPYFTSTNLGQPYPPPKPRQNERMRWLERRQPLAITLALTGAIREECRRIGARLVLLKFGVFGHEENPIAKDFSAEFLTALGERFPDLPVLDLDAAFVERGLTHEQMFNGNRDRHWNAFGHGVVAGLLREHLERTGLLADSKPPANL